MTRSGLGLFGAVAGLAMSKVIPVNGACIEVGAVDAGELGLAVDLDAAAAAHAGAVDHDGVEAGDDGDLVLAAGLGGELHHGNGADAEGVVDGIRLAEAGERQGDDALLAHGAVIGGDVQAGQRQRVELLVQDYQVLGAGTHDDVDVLALLAQHAGNGVGDGQTNAAAHDGDGIALDLGGLAQRAGDVLDVVALVELGEALGGLANYHEDELDPALLSVPVGERERHALTRLVDAHHEELAGVSLLSHPRGVDAELEDLLRELRLLQDLKHRTPLYLLEMLKTSVLACPKLQTNA